ncbi:MAG: TonB-dependent receptor plug domain-containing protein, partial [Flavobacteriales bacterium]|nr:TonB-dependent receptor plug domain-containing protein [Flavobacteriales bacterium]
MRSLWVVVVLCLPWTVLAQIDTLKTDSIHGTIIVPVYPTTFGDSPTKIIKIPEITVSGYHLDEKSTLRTQSFSHNMIEKLGVQSLTELLKTQTNVYVKEYGASGLGSPSIRGTGAGHTQVYWNGLPVNSTSLGQSDLSILDGNLSDAVSLAYGSAAAYSSGALGGTIDLMDRLRWNNHSEVWYRQQYGSFGSQSSLLKFQKSTNRVSFSAKAIHTLTDNNYPYVNRSGPNTQVEILENAQSERYGANGSLGWTKDRHTVKGSVFFSDVNRSLPTIIGIPSKGEKQLDQSLYGVVDYQYKAIKWQNQLLLGVVNAENVYYNPQIGLKSKNSTGSLTINNQTNVHLNEHFRLMTRFTGRRESASSKNFAEEMNRDILGSYLKLERNKSKTTYWVSVRTEIVDGGLNPILPQLGGKLLIAKEDAFVLKWNAGRNYRMPTLNDLYWNPGGNLNLLSEIGHSADMSLTWNTSGEVSAKGKLRNEHFR